MRDICEGTAATGEDALHPGENILTAGNSFEELESTASAKKKCGRNSEPERDNSSDKADFASDDEEV